MSIQGSGPSQFGSVDGVPGSIPVREKELKFTKECPTGGVRSLLLRSERRSRWIQDFNEISFELVNDLNTLVKSLINFKNCHNNHYSCTNLKEGREIWFSTSCWNCFSNFNKGKEEYKLCKNKRLVTPNCPLLQAPPSSVKSGHLSLLFFTVPQTVEGLLQTSGKIRLLDVGSCFNPFMKFEEFLTVGIDIVPAVESVYKCDFLNLQLQQPLQLAQDAIDAFLKQLKNPIDSLPGELFHVVVFSLLLSYFPSPYQRWICCKKAHELLMLNGLLLIITPDSSHQNRHAMMMKSWKIAIESLGFKRFKYSKFSHMHLMAFRKISLKTTSDLVSRNYPGMLYIPQDFNSIEDEDYSNTSCYVRSDIEDEQLAYGFTELPDAPYDSDSGESQASSIPFYELEDPILLLS
ncbi:hypothetical protein QTO34_004814 [Cnephaeus nilssonii]|uniref:S-adenosylmethionine sensor upstream of mTORC1 n=1 Tax=Cnephaeus nilssonii TaxID=3371016 RepID=A0AA40HPZ1_CNENI|nr:hypothetical protein QTO34_004814 [Eptesicus nilssonii]